MGLSQKELIATLTDKNLSLESLRGVGSQVDALAPFRPGPGFPQGVPALDAVRVRVSVKPEELGTFIGGIAKEDLVRSWRVFPLGIVDPDRFEIDVDIGQRFR
jgi:hypothetical protein